MYAANYVLYVHVPFRVPSEARKIFFGAFSSFYGAVELPPVGVLSFEGGREAEAQKRSQGRPPAKDGRPWCPKTQLLRV